MLSFETLNRTFINYYYFVKTKLVFIYIHFNMFPFLWCDQLISCCEYRQYSKYLGYLVFSSNRMSCIVPTKLEVLERKKFVLAIHLICKLPTLHYVICFSRFCNVWIYLFTIIFILSLGLIISLTGEYVFYYSKGPACSNGGKSMSRSKKLYKIYQFFLPFLWQYFYFMPVAHHLFHLTPFHPQLKSSSVSPYP